MKIAILTYGEYRTADVATKSWNVFDTNHDIDVYVHTQTESVEQNDNFIPIGPYKDTSNRAFRYGPKEYGYNSIQELYDYFVNDVVHTKIVDKLRNEFPSTKIFTIPTGWAAINLAQMKLDNLLIDNINMFGPKSTSIFTDDKGHQGQIVIETGTLLWLEGIYNVNLNTNNYYTGFNTDLHSIAQEISSNHDTKYKN